MQKLCSFFIAGFLLVSCTQKKQVDLIIHDAMIYTVDSNFGTQEAMAVADGKIVAVGSDAEILGRYDAKQKEDAKQKFIYPGFIDAHAHFLGYGRSLFEVNLYDCKSADEMIDRVKTFAAAHPEEQWIIGRGWDQNKFPGREFPDNQVLNKIFSDKPVLLHRIDGHAALANAKALDIANIKANDHLEGGTIETKNGVLTGILIDNAVDVVTRKIPTPTSADYEKWLVTAQKNCFAAGLTNVADCGLSYQEIDKIDSLQQQGKLLMRVYALISDDPENYKHWLAKGPYHTERLQVKGFKVYADGALGSRGACLLQPYNDKPGWNGFLLSSVAHFDSVAQMLSNTDFQMCTHAIGDSGNRVILNVYNKYLPAKNDRRWRIEHAQVVSPEDFALFGKACVIPSVQPTHATSDMYWAEERLGKERLKHAYAYKKLLQQNGWIALGTDFPVEDISPLKTFLAAVFRRDAKGFPDDGFQAENALTREEAIKGMTIWAAKADFLEKEIGSLEPGKRADFVILDHDLMKTQEREILKTNIVATYLDGIKVFTGK